MNNHYHMIIETPDGNLSLGMRQLNGVYTQIYNRRHHRVGHIFQGRYKAVLIKRESHLLEVCRYVVLNPVRAKAVEIPEAWHWSSYRSTGGIEKPHACLATDWILGQFATKRSRAEKAYLEFVAAGIGGPSIWEKVRGGSILGDDEFIESLIGYVRGQRDIDEIPKRQRFINRKSLPEILGMPADKSERNGKVQEAVIHHGYSQREVAAHLGLHYSTISGIMRLNIPTSKT